MKKILLILTLAMGCSSAFAARYFFRCLLNPDEVVFGHPPFGRTHFFDAEDDEEAIAKVTSAENMRVFVNEDDQWNHQTISVPGCGSMRSVQTLTRMVDGIPAYGILYEGNRI